LITFTGLANLAWRKPSRVKESSFCKPCRDPVAATPIKSMELQARPEVSKTFTKIRLGYLRIAYLVGNIAAFVVF
jgi:hypothetical protein